jgi:factor associated with neutral sphingomyelinase activation
MSHHHHHGNGNGNGNGAVYGNHAATTSAAATTARMKEAVSCLHPRRSRNSVVKGQERNRFNHLLLEYGERHLHDWAVVASSALGSASSMNGQHNKSALLGAGAAFSSLTPTPKPQTHSQPPSPKQSSVLNSPPSTCMGRIEGRLRLCSNSVVFEPDDWTRGIIRLPFNRMEGLPTLMVAHTNPFKGNKVTFKDNDTNNITSSNPFKSPSSTSPDQTVVIKSSRHLVMKTKNVIAPFDNLDFCTVFRFTFLHSSPQKFLELSNLILEAMQPNGSGGIMGDAYLPTPQKVKRSASATLKQIVQPTVDRPFDPSNFCDVRETPLTSNLRCRILTPLLSQPGCAIVTNTHVYHQPSSGIASPNGHSHHHGGGGNQHDNYNSNININTTHWLASKARHWALKDIIGYARRYNNGLKDSGLELFWRTGGCVKVGVGTSSTSNRTCSVLLAFDTPSDRERVIRFLPADIFCHTDRKFVLQAIQQWQMGHLSNFEYLLALNSAAGRTFHDLSRYPVFPWIIKDYKSSKLSLTKHPEKTFRDLSKPVGALDEKRLQYFLSRYESMKEAGSMDEPFIYGTHYSAPGYVLYYLVRNMPEHMLCLQNGTSRSMTIS